MSWQPCRDGLRRGGLRHPRDSGCLWTKSMRTGLRLEQELASLYLQARARNLFCPSDRPDGSSFALRLSRALSSRSLVIKDIAEPKMTTSKPPGTLIATSFGVPGVPFEEVPRCADTRWRTLPCFRHGHGFLLEQNSSMRPGILVQKSVGLYRPFSIS